MGFSNNQDVYNILIVDDMPSNLGVLGDILREEGYRVRPVPNGRLALQAIEKSKPDLILLDIMMPEMSGYEVCHKLKENPKFYDIPIIFISALNETNDIVKALSVGGVDYITKPFQAEEVKARVNTQLKIHQQNNMLNELNATKDKFFSIIAHDLRGPFSGFLGLTELMNEELSSMGKEEIQDCISDLHVSALNLFRLLENLLEWAKLQKGLIQLNPRIISLQNNIEEVIKTIIEQVRKKNISITTNFPKEFEIYADENILKTLIRNLLSNAIKFTPANGSIEISAKNLPDYRAEISIKDNGIGMNNEIQKNLFRIDVKTGRKGTEGELSSGLGLILCKDFIEKHGGSIWVESEENKGSTFHFTFPMKRK